MDRRKRVREREKRGKKWKGKREVEEERKRGWEKRREKMEKGKI